MVPGGARGTERCASGLLTTKRLRPSGRGAAAAVALVLVVLRFGVPSSSSMLLASSAKRASSRAFSLVQPEPASKRSEVPQVEAGRARAATIFDAHEQGLRVRGRRRCQSRMAERGGRLSRFSRCRDVDQTRPTNFELGLASF